MVLHSVTQKCNGSKFLLTALKSDWSRNLNLFLKESYCQIRKAEFSLRFAADIRCALRVPSRKLFGKKFGLLSETTSSRRRAASRVGGRTGKSSTRRFRDPCWRENQSKKRINKNLNELLIDWQSVNLY
jgi:hypothetical protein